MTEKELFAKVKGWHATALAMRDAMWYQSAEQEMWERGWMLCFAIGEI